MNLQTLSVLLGVITAAAVLARGLWRIIGAAHALIKAIKENTSITGELSGQIDALRESTHERIDHLAERIAWLEGGTHGEGQPAADPRPAHRGHRGPGPHRGGGMGPV